MSRHHCTQCQLALACLPPVWGNHRLWPQINKKIYFSLTTLSSLPTSPQATASFLFPSQDQFKINIKLTGICLISS